MSTTVAGTEVRRYLEAVRTHLEYLPPEDRDELLEDVEEHLLEVAAEKDGTLEQRLGPASAYAEELRASAGLPGRGDAVSIGVIAWLSKSRVIRSAAAALDSSSATAARRFMREVSPGWWVLRGYLGVVLYGVFVARDNGLIVRESVPLPRVFGSYGWGVLLIPVAIWVSLRLGRAAARDWRARVISLAATGVVLAVGVTFLGDLDHWSYAYGSDETSYETSNLHHADGSTIANICPYSADGKLLTGVLLFDQIGRPITNAANEVEGRAVEQAKPAILNVYPKSVSLVDVQGEVYNAETGTTEFRKTLTPLPCPASVTAGAAIPSPIPSTRP